MPRRERLWKALDFRLHLVLNFQYTFWLEGALLSESLLDGSLVIQDVANHTLTKSAEGFVGGFSVSYGFPPDHNQIHAADTNANCAGANCGNCVPGCKGKPPAK